MSNDKMYHTVWQEGEDRPGDQASPMIIRQVSYPQVHGPAGKDEAEQHGEVVTPGGTEEQASR